jgi:hypothetical protein
VVVCPVLGGNAVTARPIPAVAMAAAAIRAARKSTVAIPSVVTLPDRSAAYINESSVNLVITEIRI